VKKASAFMFEGTLLNGIRRSNTYSAPRNALRMPEVLAMGADKKFIVNLSSRISEACRLMH
jgi:hypothetical protein